MDRQKWRESGRATRRQLSASKEICGVVCRYRVRKHLAVHLIPGGLLACYCSVVFLHLATLSNLTMNKIFSMPIASASLHLYEETLRALVDIGRLTEGVDGSKAKL